MGYFSELCRAMDRISTNPRTVFMGQAVACGGTAMSRTLSHLPKHKLVELPVMEDAQLGLAIGASLAGDIPICIYPRINFLLLAMSQLVLHLDALPDYSSYQPKVIIRTAIATPEPLNPGVQHLGNYIECFRHALRNVLVVDLWSEEQIVPEYDKAMSRPGSSLLVEHLGHYNV